MAKMLTKLTELLNLDTCPTKTQKPAFLQAFEMNL